MAPRPIAELIADLRGSDDENRTLRELEAADRLAELVDEQEAATQ